MFNLIKGYHRIDFTQKKMKPLVHTKFLIFMVLSIQSLPVSNNNCKPNKKCVDLFLWSAANIAMTVNPSKRM